MSFREHDVHNEVAAGGALVYKGNDGELHIASPPCPPELIGPAMRLMSDENGGRVFSCNPPLLVVYVPALTGSLQLQLGLGTVGRRVESSLQLPPRPTATVQETKSGLTRMALAPRVRIWRKRSGITSEAV